MFSLAHTVSIPKGGPFGTRSLASLGLLGKQTLARLCCTTTLHSQCQGAAGVVLGAARIASHCQAKARTVTGTAPAGAQLAARTTPTRMAMTTVARRARRGKRRGRRGARPGRRRRQGGGLLAAAGARAAPGRRRGRCPRIHLHFFLSFKTHFFLYKGGVVAGTTIFL